MFEGGRRLITRRLPRSAALYTALYSAAAALLATLMALPVALLVVRHPTKWTRAFTRSTFLLLAMPGIVIALALSYFSEQHANCFRLRDRAAADRGLRPHVLPIGAGGRARLGQPSAPRARGGGRSLGVPRAQVLRRVTLPLVGPGLGAAFCLVFLSCVTELTATLILIPDQRADARHAVLGVPAEPLLRPGRALRLGHHPHRRGARVPARSVL